jgi:hypothetical protein
MVALIPWPKSDRKRGRGRPFATYPLAVILKCFFVVRMWLRLDSSRTLIGFVDIDHYPYDGKIMKACRLTSPPDRRTFDRFVKEEFVDPYIVSVDSTLLKAKGHLGNTIKSDKHMLGS